MQFAIGMDLTSCRVLVTRFAAITTLVLLLAACGQEPTTSERIEQALDHRIDGDVRSAIIELRRVLQEEPRHAEARLLLGITYLDSNQMESAEKELRRARELGISSARLAVPLGRALLEQRKYVDVLNGIQVEESWPAGVRADVVGLQARALVARDDLLDAQRSIERAVGIDSESLQAGLARVELALARNQQGTAVAHARDATETHPQAGVAWRALYRAAAANGDADLAESAADRAIELIAQPAVDHLFRARLRVARGNLEQAKADLEAIDNRLQDNPRVRFVRSLIAWAEEDYESACTLVQEVVSDAPRIVEARYYHGACLYRSGEYNQAESHLSWVNQQSTESRVAHLLGLVRLELDQPELAREALRPVIERNPDDIATLALLGRVEMRLGNTTEAIRLLQRYAELRPNDSGARLELGTGLLRTGQIDAGQQALDEALSMDPDSESAGTMLVISHLQNGDHEQAAAAAQRLAEEQPEEALPWTLIAVVRLSQQDLPAARDALDEAIRRDAADPAARHYLARLALQSEDVDGARAHFRAVLEEDPGHVQTLIALASLEAQTGNGAKARDLLMQAHQADPEALHPRILLARLRIGQGDPAGALEILADAGGNVPNEPAALEIAGQAHMDLDQSTQAIGVYSRLVERVPDSARAHFLLGRAYARAGDEKASISRMERVLELEPDNPEALMLLARARVRQGRHEEARALHERLPDDVRETSFVLRDRIDVAEQARNPGTALALRRDLHEREASASTAAGLARALARHGETADALRLLRDWNADHGDDAVTRLALGDLLVDAGQEAEALQAYREALDANPNSVAALNNLAWLLRERDSGRALEYAEQAVDLAPESPAVRDTYGMILLGRGRAGAAVEQFRRAVEGAPGIPELRYKYARALAEDEQLDEALRQLRRSLEEGEQFSGRDEAKALLEQLEAE